METNAKYLKMQDAQQKAGERRGHFLDRNVPRPTIPVFEDLEPASSGYVPPRKDEDGNDLTSPGATGGDRTD
jgi:hypothetical protein